MEFVGECTYNICKLREIGELEMNTQGQLKEMIRVATVNHKLDFNWMAPNTKNIKELVEHIDQMIQVYGPVIFDTKQLEWYDNLIDSSWTNI